MTNTRTKDASSAIRACPHIHRRRWPRIAVAAIIALLLIVVPGAPVTGV